MKRGLTAAAVAVVLVGVCLSWLLLRSHEPALSAASPGAPQPEPTLLLQLEHPQRPLSDAAASPRLREARAGGATIGGVRVNAPALRALAIGDRFSLPLPSTAAALHGVIRQRVQHANGDVSLIGVIEGQAAPAVLTVGRRETYITAGGYEVTAVNGVGEMVPAAQIGAPDPSVPDYIEVKQAQPKPVVPIVLP